MKHLLTGLVMALGVGSMALPASANIFSFDTDTQFFDFGFGKLGGGNVRWGAGGGAQTWEVSIVDGGDIPTPGSEKNRNWVSGEDNLHEAVFGYGDNDAQYIGLFDTRLSDGFSVAGQGLINGGGTPAGSSPAYQFKVGLSDGVQEIPVPGTLALLGGGLLGFGLLTRRRRSVV